MKNFLIIFCLFISAPVFADSLMRKADFSVNTSLIDVYYGEIKPAFEWKGSVVFNSHNYYDCVLLVNESQYSCIWGSSTDSLTGLELFYVFQDSSDFFTMIREEATMDTSGEKALEVLEKFFSIISDKRIMYLVANGSDTSHESTRSQTFRPLSGGQYQVNLEAIAHETIKIE